MRSTSRALALAAAIIAAGCSDRSPLAGPDPAVQLALDDAPSAVAAAIPAPADGDRILVDARAAIQDANGLYEALRDFGGRKVSGRWAFTRNVDGRGTNALRVDWTNGRRDRCVVGTSSVRVPVRVTGVRRMFIQWKQVLGRTATGGGVGGVGAFAFPSTVCPGRDRTVMMARRSVDDDDAGGRVEYGWSSAPPGVFVGLSDNPAVRVGALGDVEFVPASVVGQVITQTVYLEAESAPGAGDGVVRMWADGVLVVENRAVALDNETFTAVTFPGRLPLSPTQQTEYFWDLFVWEGSGETDPDDPPPPAEVGSVDVAPAAPSLTIGSTVALTATVSSTTGDPMEDAVIAWESSHPDIASVDDAGVVTGRSVGSATIRATSGGKSGLATVTVTAVPVSSVSVAPGSSALSVNETVQLVATARDANGNELPGRAFTWESSAPAIATVSTDGLVRGVGAGDATITATSEGVDGTATVTVTVTRIPVASVTVTPASASVNVGSTVQLTAVARDADGNALTDRAITWTSDATAIARVGESGLVTAVAVGPATITATSEGVGGTASVTVTLVPVASVTVSPTAATLNVGETRQLTATVRNAAGGVLTGRVVTWTTDAAGVATVSPTGLVTARGVGSAGIRATSEGVSSGASTITVNAPPPPPPPDQGTYFVSPTGSDANPGTAAAPFRTIQRAADLVTPGDVVIVDDGVWTDTDGDGSVVAIDRGGTSSALVTFRSRNKWGAKLDGQNGRAAQGFDFNNGVGFVRIEGFEIFGIANVGTPRGSASGVDMYDGGHDSQVVGNHIHHIGRVCTTSENTNGQVGIFVQQPNITIEGNLVHDIGRFFPGESGCSYSSGFHGYQTLDHGVYLNGGSPGADGAMIRNNIFYNTRHGWAVQFYPGSLSNVHVLNNTFAFGNPNKNFTHIVLDASISGSSIRNNIFYNPEGGRTIEAVGFSGSITIGNNITRGSAMTDRSSTPSGMTMTANQLGTDPRFVNAALFDFHLQSGSPAIDAGVALSQVTIDFDGRLRPRGGALDIGAYEF